MPINKHYFDDPRIAQMKRQIKEERLRRNKAKREALKRQHSSTRKSK